MVHHIPRYLARKLVGAAHRKLALIVVDEIAIDQWIVLRNVLTEQRPQLRLREDAVFRLGANNYLRVSTGDLCRQTAALFPVKHSDNGQRTGAVVAILAEARV